MLPENVLACFQIVDGAQLKSDVGLVLRASLRFSDAPRRLGWRRYPGPTPAHEFMNARILLSLNLLGYFVWIPSVSRQNTLVSHYWFLSRCFRLCACSHIIWNNICSAFDNRHAKSLRPTVHLSRCTHHGHRQCTIDSLSRLFSFAGMSSYTCCFCGLEYQNTLLFKRTRTQGRKAESDRRRFSALGV